MTSSNQHTQISLEFIHKELGPIKYCTRPSCKGTMVEVWTRYKDHGKINREMECHLCGKVIKDPTYIKEKMKKRKQWDNNKNEKTKTQYYKRKD